jgi:UDP-N-acetylglucosamine:LPS N-acetylglucosamine transferase
LEELKLYAKASILLPLGRKTSRGEQEANARYLESKGATVVLYEPVDPDRFVLTVRSLIDDPMRREALAETMGSLGDGSAARRIGEIILGWRNE